MTDRETMLRKLVTHYLSFDGVPYCQDGSTLEERFLEWHGCTDEELRQVADGIEEELEQGTNKE